MEQTKAGALIRQLRIEQDLTQKQLADRLHLSDKTISNWERGLGLPDIFLLDKLSEVLGVDLSALLAGKLPEQAAVPGNMQKTAYFVCPVCGSLTLSTGKSSISCCGRPLTALTPKEATENCCGIPPQRGCSGSDSEQKLKALERNTMDLTIFPYTIDDIDAAAAIWNQVVADGVAFPQTEPLTAETGHAFFSEQSFTGLARENATGQIVGLYILHPNNVGRCGHICNASYAVKAGLRGQGVGEALVCHCMDTAKSLGFGILQFNAVVATNAAALHLYEKLGFTKMAVIPGGFRLDDGTYADIIPHYKTL